MENVKSIIYGENGLCSDEYQWVAHLSANRKWGLNFAIDNLVHKDTKTKL